jgi:transposase InsO family protein
MSACIEPGPWVTPGVLQHTTDKAQKYAESYIDRIVCLHGLSRTIVSGQGAQFVARFWEQLQKSLGTKLIRSSAYHPQTDGQTERVNQILEDMLRPCAIDCGKNWDNTSLWQSLHITTFINPA